MKKLLAYLQLFRIPNVFTALSDVMMGFLFTLGSLSPLEKLLPLLVSSGLLYTAGMVLNDVFDYEVDKEERPERPLPSGRIDLAWARVLGFGMLGCGVLIAMLVGPRSGMVATVLAMAIYVYDGVAKKTEIAPAVMGSCRTLNVMLGMSCATAFETDQLLIALGLGIYVAGITQFARSEARESDRRMLIQGFAVMAGGIVMLGVFPWYTLRPLLFKDPIVFPTLLVLLMVSVVRRCVIVISDPKPQNVQTAVKHSILTLIILDATVVLAAAGPKYALGVAALLIPTVLLGRWVYST